MKRRIMPLLLFVLLLTGTVLFVHASGSPNYESVNKCDTRMDGYIQFQPSYVQNGMQAAGGSLSTTYNYRNPNSGHYSSDTITRYLPTDKLPTDSNIYSRFAIHYKNSHLGECVGNSSNGRFDWVPEGGNLWPVNNPENPVGQ